MSRLLRDAKLFDAKLGQIDGAGNTGMYLVQLVEAKAVVAPSEPESKKSEEKKMDKDAKKEEEQSAKAVS
jgi:vacuolar protein sorting-associated protein 54